MTGQMTNLADLPGSPAEATASLWGRWWKLLAGATAVGFVGSTAGLIISARVHHGVPQASEFYGSYLTAYLFVLTLVLGMLFWVMLHHAADAGWSVVVRRPAEQCLAALGVLVVLFLPVALAVFGGSLFGWTASSGAGGAEAQVLAAKRPFLNLPFFFIRAVGYFAVWLTLAWIVRGKSLAQDRTGEARLSLSMRRWSSAGFLPYALTFTLASVDWAMTLDYEWYSTIFGVYVWSGAAAGSMALLSLLAIWLRCGPLRGMVSEDRLHDLGNLLFTFSVFWAYIAFSQFLLIWYANIPEEAVWYLGRWRGGWRAVGVALPVGRFIIPFVVLLSATAKRRPAVLGSVAALVLVFHYVDLYWIIMPTCYRDGPAWGQAWVDVSTLLLVGGLSALAVLRALAAHPAYPVRDPRLAESVQSSHDEHGTLAEGAHG